MDLPPPEARDEDENWSEEMKEDFHWYFGFLLETRPNLYRGRMGLNRIGCAEVELARL